MNFDALKIRYANLKAKAEASYYKAKAAAATPENKDTMLCTAAVAAGSLVAEVITSVFEEL